MIEAAIAADLPRGIVLADYGNKSVFRDRLDDLRLQYAVAIPKETHVRRVDGRGKRRKLGDRKSVEDLAFELDPTEIRRVTWREGTKATMSSIFAVVRVEPVPTDGRVRPEQCLIIEWPDQHTPAKYNLATIPRTMSRKRLIRTLKERWRTERTYQGPQGRSRARPLRGTLVPRLEPPRHDRALLFRISRCRTGASFPPSQARERDTDDALHRAA